MDTYHALIKRLDELCEARGITRHALAITSGIHPSTVKGIFNGASQNPGIVTIKKLCDGLDISITDFFNTEIFRELEQEIK